MKNWGREISVGIAIAVFALIMAVVAPSFFSLENLSDVMLANLPVLIVAVGMTLVILTGQIDISVGSQFAVCGVAAGVLAKSGLPIPVAALATCLLGASLGALNGVLVSWLRIPSIVVTLATMVALRDGLRWITDGAWVQDLPAGFQWFGLPPTGSALLSGSIALGLLIATAWVLQYVATGRAVYATGSDANATRLAGIDPDRVTLAVFIITGVLTAGAAVLNAVRFSQIPANAGMGLEMKVIAAVVVGGTAITGGRGTIPGTLLGVILLGAAGPALTFLGVSAYWERAIQGAIILAAVAVDAFQTRRSRKAHG